MNVQWTYMLTRLQRYACHFVRWILYITLHTANLKAGCHMHFIAHSQVHSWLHSIAHSQPARLYAPNCSRWHTPRQLDLRSQVSSQDAPMYTPGHALKDSFNCTRWHTPSLLDCTLPSTLPGMLSRTLPIALDGTLPASLTVRSEVSSQDALKHTSEHALNSQLHSMTHSQPAWLYAPK